MEANRNRTPPLPPRTPKPVADECSTLDSDTCSASSPSALSAYLRSTVLSGKFTYTSVSNYTSLLMFQKVHVISQCAADADDTLFRAVLANDHHVLRHLLPVRTSHSYSLRPRRHDCSLTIKADSRNFITRQLFTDMY